LSNGEEVRLLGICRSLFSRKGCFPFVYCGSFGPLIMTDDLRHDLEGIAHRIVSSTKLRGLFTIDYLQEPSGRLWLLEINPRWSGSSEVIERYLRHRQGDVSLMAWVLDALDGSPLALPTPCDRRDLDDRFPVYLKRIVFARRDQRFNAARLRPILCEQDSLHDLPTSGRLVRRGEPVCTLITRLSGEEQDPMRRHRVLVDQIAGSKRR
jgi:predicted ATP-grasp superfamily ATP-dependent carboligase